MFNKKQNGPENTPDQIDEKFPDRKQDLDHRELYYYMQEKKIRHILTDMIAYLVVHRYEDHLQGAIDFFLNTHCC